MPTIVGIKPTATALRAKARAHASAKADVYFALWTLGHEECHQRSAFRRSFELVIKHKSLVAGDEPRREHFVLAVAAPIDHLGDRASVAVDRPPPPEGDPKALQIPQRESARRG